VVARIYVLVWILCCDRQTMLFISISYFHFTSNNYVMGRLFLSLHLLKKKKNHATLQTFVVTERRMKERRERKCV
jgi:hypothetical protein